METSHINHFFYGCFEKEEKMKILKGIIKFLPVIILATLMIKEFDALIAAPIATIAALVIAIMFRFQQDRRRIFV